MSKLDIWKERWDLGKIGFHKDITNPNLEAFYDNLAVGRESLTFLVPLCGKTLDLFWLYSKGHTVIGVEGVTQAIQEFFSRHELDYTVEPVAEVDGQCYSSLDKRISIYNCDICKFKLPTHSDAPVVDCVWDRGSFIALYLADRPLYVEVLRPLLKPNFRYLMEIVDYEATVGPEVTPRKTNPNEVAEIYGDEFKVEVLQTTQKTPDLIPQVKSNDIVEYILLLTKRAAD